MKKKDNKQSLLDTPSTIMTSEENYYQEYKGKMAILKFDKQSFCQK